MAAPKPVAASKPATPVVVAPLFSATTPSTPEPVTPTSTSTSTTHSPFSGNSSS
jgi:hypothetical protein